jgi:hypothetical protein
LKTLLKHWGNGAPPGAEIGMAIDFSQVAQQAAAGGTAVVHPALAALTLDDWSQNNESALHFLGRVTESLGGLMRVTGGNQIELTVPGANADGSTPATITAQPVCPISRCL